MNVAGWGQPNGFASSIHSSPPIRQCRKSYVKAAGAPTAQQWQMGKTFERWNGRCFRLVSNRRTGLFVASLIAFVSLLMLLNDVKLVSFHLKRFAPLPVRDGREAFERARQLEYSAGSWNSTDLHPNDTSANGSAYLTLMTLNDPTPERPGSSWKKAVSHHEEPAQLHRFAGSRTHPSIFSSDSFLPQSHPCSNFSFPPPPADKKRTGPRPCPVCYLPMEAASKEMPVSRSTAEHVIKELSYVTRQDVFEATELVSGSDFGGHQTLEERKDAFEIRESMHLHCGFARGLRPGLGSGFDFDIIDKNDMDSCRGVVVASAIFGNYDVLQQPKNIGEESKSTVCFFMFVDEDTAEYLARADFNQTSRKIGLWRLVVVHNLPFQDARRNGKVPKLLIHRLFPNARFSLWVDGKLELVVDPYQILERFLWRSNDTFAISKHYRRFDVYKEAEANKAARKYDNASIDAQVEFYRKEGLAPYSSSKLPIVSDVPEGCVIIREHIPITNLFGCLWFNEVDRFTSRDQLSFAIVRDKLIAQTLWRVNMFRDCERRNFVVQIYHKDLLELMSEHKSSQESPPSLQSFDTHVKDNPRLHKNRKVLPGKKKTGKRKGEGSS